MTSQCLNKCWHNSLGLNEFSFIPLYHDTLCRCVFVCISHNVYERNSCFWFYMYVTLFFPFKHLLLCIYHITFTCVYYLCIYYITLPVWYISLCIYRFIYWKSGTSDHFGANVTCFTMYRLQIKFSYSYSYLLYGVSFVKMLSLTEVVSLEMLFCVYYRVIGERDISWIYSINFYSIIITQINDK